MRRVWLVVIIAIVAIAGDVRPSEAVKIPDPPCANPIALPKPGARDVPTNARIWLVGGGRLGVTRDVVITGGSQMQMFADWPTGNAQWPIMSVLPKLAADHSYLIEVDGESTTFTTGSVEDHDAPTPPEEASVQIVLMPGKSAEHTIAELDLYAGLADDTALVRVDLAQAGRAPVTIYVPTSYRHVAELPVSLVEGPVTVTLTAIDLAGNESAPATVQAEASVDPRAHHDVRCELRPHHGRPRHVANAAPMDPPPDLTGVALAIGIALATMVSVIILVALMRRYRRPADDVGSEPASLLLVEVAARTIRRTSIVLLVSIVAAIAGLAVLCHSPFAATFVPWLVPASLGVWIPTAMLRAIARGDATATLLGSTLLVRAGDDDRPLAITLTIPELLAARERAVPTARMRD